MIYRIELHCHSFYSGDGVSSPEEIIASAKKKGLNGFAMTDHNTCDAVRYMLAKGLMRDDGLPVDDFLIIPGVEVSTAEGHLLCLGAILPNLKGRPAKEVCEIAHTHGAIVIPPHPYDILRAGIRESVLEKLPLDALEVFNAATTFKRCNRQALAYAQQRGLPMTAGSDAHHFTAIGTSFMLVEPQEFSVRGVLAEIAKKENGAQRNEQYLTRGDKLRKTWNNWLRLTNRRPKSA